MNRSDAPIDVFISYKREERHIAEALATALVRRGYALWWDVELLPGDRFANAILAVLERANAVVVLWSKKAVGSAFVCDEARRANAREKPIPVRIDDCELPLGFGELETLDLRAWWPKLDESKLVPLLRTLGARISKPPAPLQPNMAADAILHAQDSEAKLWRSISEHEPPSAEEYQLYLDRHPNGLFVEFARLRIEEINRTLGSGYLTDHQYEELIKILDFNLSQRQLIDLLKEPPFATEEQHSIETEKNGWAIRIASYCRANAARLVSVLRYLLKAGSDEAVLRRELRCAFMAKRRPPMSTTKGAIVILCPDSLSNAAQTLRDKLRSRPGTAERKIELIHELDPSPQAPGNLISLLEVSSLVIECFDRNEQLPSELFAPMLALTAKVTRYTVVYLSDYEGELPSDAVDLREAATWEKEAWEQVLSRLEDDAGIDPPPPPPQTVARRRTASGRTSS